MDLVEALHTLARQRGRGDSPIIALRDVPPRPGARISHLAIGQGLAQAWVAVTGEPFHQHQSLALAALRRGEPLALVGGHAARQSAHLLALELLRAEAPATALLLAPDEPAAAAHRASLARIAAALGGPLRVGLALGDEARAAMAAHVVVATPAALHERLLRYHDRAWAAFWSRLRLIVVGEAHAYDGLAAAHLAALLLRAHRLAPGDAPPRLLATIGPVAGADEALAQITGAAWRIIAADDTPAPATALALWRAPGERARETVALALGLARAGARVHLTCPAFEAPLLQALIGPDEAAVSVGPTPLPAQAQIFAGLAGAAAHLRQALDGAALAVLVLGDDPAERTLARLAARDPEQLPLIDGPAPTWVAAAGNAYVAAQHLVCAASERPLVAEEIEAWQAATIVPRLEQRGLLVSLPGPEPAWHPLASGDDPYASFDLRGAGSAPARVSDEQGAALGSLEQATFDRWAFVGAALPPLRGGYRVVGRDDDGLGLTLRPTPEPRRTVPLRRCDVRVRDRREHRLMRGRELAWGRVLVTEEVYGYREAAPGSAPAERALNPPIEISWSAPALWVDLPAPVGAAGQLIGWSLAAALPLRALADPTGLAPAYDAESRRLYFIDAQPGGNGLATWLFSAFEELLPLAYDIALDCRNDPLLEPLARADMDWLLALLGGSLGAAPATAPRRPAAPRPADDVRPPVRLPAEDEEALEGEDEEDDEELEIAGEEEDSAEDDEELLEDDSEEERERARQERARQERAEREYAARAERERAARERAEQERREQERIEREQREREARERAEHERREREARERAEQERREQERIEREQREQREREARERAERERAEQERIEREQREQREREARERAEREAWQARELAARRAWEEQQRAAREARERAEREEQERREREREARERAEREAREAKERAEQAAREAREREEQERAIREARARAEQAERERLARERKAQEARERAEQAERERLAREREAQEARERAERAERERLARERKAQEARQRAEQAERESRRKAPARRDPPARQEQRGRPGRGSSAPAPRQPPPRQPPPEPEVMPDAASMVARLRQMREQREGRSKPAPAPPRARPAPAHADADAARFHPGDAIVCTPYGRGEVLASRIEDDREILVVAFPEHGELTIDAAVSAARLVESRPPPDDDPPL